MKHTKEQLQGMSDFEVNKTLAVLLGWRVAELDDQSGFLTTAYHERYPNTIWAGKPDHAWEQYCFTAMDCAGDLMPLSFEHKICLINESDGGWIAFLFDRDEFEFANENPLRAIACCLILLLQDKE